MHPHKHNVRVLPQVRRGRDPTTREGVRRREQRQRVGSSLQEATIREEGAGPHENRTGITPYEDIFDFVCVSDEETEVATRVLYRTCLPRDMCPVS